MKKLLLSLICSLAVSSALAQEVKQEQVVLADNTSFTSQVVEQTTTLVNTAVDTITSPFLTPKEIDCLARNIFYEAGSEPVEGKVAVGMVTLNRSQDDRYPDNVCSVVKQKTVLSVPKQIKEVKTVKTGYFSETHRVVEVHTKIVQKVVYQFSWVGQRTPKIKEDDPRWVESKKVAEELANGGYENWQEKYANAMNFHAVYVKPGWKLKKIARVGNHIFYEGTRPVQQGG